MKTQQTGTGCPEGCALPIPEGAQGKVGWGLEELGLVERGWEQEEL